MAYKLIIDPKAGQFLKKLKKKNSQADNIDGGLQKMVSVEITKDKDHRELDAFMNSLTDEEIDELNIDEGGTEEPMPFEEFCRKEGIRLLDSR